MKITSAMAVNLSLLTADFYTLVIGVLLFQFKVIAIQLILYIINMNIITLRLSTV